MMVNVNAAPVLYFDLASPYAYLAVARAERVLGRRVELEPILVGAIFNYRGRGSWAATDEREPRVREIEERAERYGLPPLTWPERWPANSLAAMRAATWAKRCSRLEPFVHATFEREFVGGA